MEQRRYWHTLLVLSLLFSHSTLHLTITCFGLIMGYMNEKITKKIGEAYAFAQVLETTYATNEVVVTELLQGASSAVAEATAAQKAALAAICEEVGMTDILLPKVDKTAEKITKMGEMYVGDDWDDAAEVLEWLSFFVGGAIVHWQLIAGAGEAMGHTDLQGTAVKGVVYYEHLMDHLKLSATAIGEARSH